jgi:NADH dehydrogenase FAD-containing subunit
MAQSVLILGGGLAGVACAHKLGDEGMPVTLVDRNDYHQFQPLLYRSQVRNCLPRILPGRIGRSSRITPW